MAEMIPDRMPPGTSIGEKRLFEILQRLPDDCIVYYEPIIAGRYPDFVVILPDLGLLILEAKGWLLNHIVKADSHDVTVLEGGIEKACKHPVRQARDYMYGLMDVCRRHSEYLSLVDPDGKHKGRFIFPFGHCAILTRITGEQFAAHTTGDLESVFPPSLVRTADALQSWGQLSADELKDALRPFFNPTWDFPRLSARQVDILRAVLHPEIRLSPPPAEIAVQRAREAAPAAPAATAATVPVPAQGELFPTGATDLKVLDLKQENMARSIGDGHRLVSGVAGSGKTVLLISRAKLAAIQSPDERVLVLCFNIALAAYLRTVLSEQKNIVVQHFHGWAAQHGCPFNKNETLEQLGARLLSRLSQGVGDAGKYSAVLVDEAQDFDPSWFKCVLAAMKEPVDGDLLIVGDGSQGLYPHRQLSWKELGIHAPGRTKRLERNYRNTRQILEAAACVAPDNAAENEDELASYRAEPASALRDGPRPILVAAATRVEECQRAVALVKNLLGGQWGADAISPLKPEEIGVLYPMKQPVDFFDHFIHELRSVAPTRWINDPRDRESKSKVCEPGLKVQTVHSAKGLQYRAVILMFAHDLPFIPRASEPEDETERIGNSQRLLYVALTRPEDYLAVSFTASKSSIFTEKMRDCGKFTLL